MDHKNLIILLNIVVLTLLCIADVSSKQTAKVLNLKEGDVCKKDKISALNHLCKLAEKCETLPKPNKMNQNYTYDLCSLSGSKPIICCPPKNGEVKNASIADEKCNQYLELAKKYAKNPKIKFIGSLMRRKVGRYGSKHLLDEAERKRIVRRATAKTFVVGGTEAVPTEFPHMALLGYGDTVKDAQWGCGGSLISERWILTAAHCTLVGSANVTRWARVGELNTETNLDNARPKNYQITKVVLHPDYKPPSLYNDIALFRLDKDVEFNAYARPICLNTKSSANPKVLIATGWGSTYTAGPASAHLLKVNLNVIPANQCNISYSSSMGQNLKSGILNDRMICAGSTTGKDTCSGDSGGPLQLRNVDNFSMFTQFGITSFGKFCGDNTTPGVYTRVSKYVPWIEKIVWPKA